MASSAQPVCTVAIPVYNRRELVRHALDSALAQDVSGLEVLVVDNCSTDGTWEALCGFDDPRLRLVRNDENVGLFGNLNRCLELARGRYLRILCSDDRLTSGCIARELALMDQNPGAALISTRARRLDASGNPAGVFADQLAPGSYPGQETVALTLSLLSRYCRNPLNYPSGILLRTDAAHAAGRFDSAFKLVGDLDFWFRVLQHGDALIAEHIGCDVMAHDGQEGQALFEDGAYIEEWFALAERWQAVLDSVDLTARVREQTVACAVWAAFACARRGRRAAAARNWRAAMRHSASALSLVRSVARFARDQAGLRVAARRRPAPPPTEAPRPGPHRAGIAR